MDRRLWSVVGAVIAAVLLLAATGSATAGTRRAALVAAPFAQSWSQVPKSAAARKAKDIVVIGEEQDPSGFNVNQATQASAWAGYELTPVIRGMYIITDQGEYKLDLATSVTADKTKLDIKIRPDANWNWGGKKSPVTGADFKYTLDSYLDPKSEPASNTGYVNIDPSKTKLIGNKEVQFFWRTSCPAGTVAAGTCATGAFADYRDLFGVVYPSKAVAGLDWNTLWSDCICGTDGKPISDGPYILTNWTKGQGTTETANPFWYGKKPKIRELQWKFVADTNTEIQAMRGGELDMIFPSPQTALGSLINQPGLVYQTNRAYITEHLEIQVDGVHGNPLLKNAWMRQAIFLAINRVSLIKAIFSSYAPGVKPLNSFEYILGKAAVPHFGKWATSQKKAIALLKAHGCTGGPSVPTRGNSAVFTCGGQQASFRWYTTVGNSRRATSAAIFQQQLGAVGIKVTPQFFPGPAVLFGNLLPAGDFDIAEYAGVAGSPDPSNNDSLFVSSGGQNYGHYQSAKVDALIKAAATDFNPTTRQQKYEQVDTILSTDVPRIPLYTYPAILVHKSALGGMEHSDASLSTGPAWNAEEWFWKS
jgi:peptide/nickel transport system substrate-binding protein